MLEGLVCRRLNLHHRFTRHGNLVRTTTPHASTNNAAHSLHLLACDDLLLRLSSARQLNHGWLVLNIWHNAQYILTVWLFNNNRFKEGMAINFHYYVVDAVIWKVRRKPVQQNFGIAT